MILKNAKHAFGGLKFNWNRRLYVWRASFYYNFCSVLLALAILFTFIFHVLLKRFSFFVNYSCSSRSIRTMTFNILVIMIITGLIFLMSLYLGRVCNIFSNYTLTDFKSTGKWLNRMGFTVKWFPWFIALLMFFWLILLIINISWIFINPRHWCSYRWVDEAVSAVRNCRIVYSTDPGCVLEDQEVNYTMTRECNSPITLETKFFIPFATKTPQDTCSVTNRTVCETYKAVVSGKTDIDWTHRDLVGCAGPAAKKPQDYLDYENSSDLYKYTQLFAIVDSVVYCIIVGLFFFIKKVTEFDAMLYQPKDPNESLFFKIIRPLTPWSS